MMSERPELDRDDIGIVADTLNEIDRDGDAVVHDAYVQVVANLLAAMNVRFKLSKFGDYTTHVLLEEG